MALAKQTSWDPLDSFCYDSSVEQIFWEKSASSARKLREALDEWIPLRKETITTVNRMARDVAGVNDIADGFKMVTTSVGFALGVVGLLVTGGLGGAAVFAFELACGGANVFAETTRIEKLKDLQRKHMETYGKELKQYQVVIKAFADLYKCIEEQNNYGPQESKKRCVALAEAGGYSDIELKAYMKDLNDLNTQIEKASNTATYKVLTESKEVLKWLRDIAKIARKAAEETVSEVTSEAAALALTEGQTWEAALDIAEGVGKAAMRAMINTVSKKAAGANLKVDKELIEFVKTARKAAGLKVLFEVAGAEIPAEAATKTQTENTMKKIGRRLPLLKAGVFLLGVGIDVYETGRQIYVGETTVRKLREMTCSLKQEICEKVIPIYNCYAKRLYLDQLDIPEF
jgi:hypothetical protein